MRAATFPSFTQAVLPDPFVVFGRRLAPFSLGHAMLLTRLANPLIVGGARPTRAQLIQALVICSRPVNIDNPLGPLPLSLRSWAARISVLLRFRPSLLASRAAMFLAYVEAATEQRPERWLQGPATDASDHPSTERIPAMVGLWLDLLRLGFTHGEAFNLPLGFAIWAVMADAADRGQVDLVTEADERLYQMANAEVPPTTNHEPRTTTP